MHSSQSDTPSGTPVRAPGLRLVRIIVVETVAVAIIGGLVWGVAWDAGYPKAGLIAAIIIWLTVSPIIEIATVLKYRNPDATKSRDDASLPL